MSPMITHSARKVAGCALLLILLLILATFALLTLLQAAPNDPGPATQQGPLPRVLELQLPVVPDPLTGTDAGLITTPATMDGVVWP